MNARAARLLLSLAALACLTALAAGLFHGAPVLAAGNRYVSPVGVDTGDCTNIASPCLTLAYGVAQAIAGDTVHVAAGTYTGAGNQHVVIDKALTLDGDGPATTILAYNPAVKWLAGGRNGVLEIRASDVTVRDLTIRDAPTEDAVAVWGVRVWKNGGSVANVAFENVRFLNNAARGLEIHNLTTVTGLTITNCLFEDNGGHGIRLASNARVSNFTITGTTFRHNGHTGLLESMWSPPTAGPASYIDGLHIAGSTFDGNTVGDVQFGDARNVVIENSTFTGSGRGIAFIDNLDTPDAIGGVTIEGNTMSDFAGPAVLVDITNTALDAAVTISGNTITQAANLVVAGGAAIDIGLAGAPTNAAVEISDNSVTYSGLAPAPLHGVRLAGGLDDVAVTGNALDGGGMGGGGGEPASSGLYLASTSATYGPIDADDAVEATLNEITGFVNGVSVYDEAGAAFGGLPAANSVSIVRNSLAGNDDFGARSGPANPTTAICNWWGSATGPSGAGPGAGDAVSANVLFAPWLATADLQSSLCGGVNDLFVGTNKKGTIDGIPFDDVDILALDHDTGTWSMFFDGGDVGVVTNLTGFAFEPGGCLLISFDGNEKKLPGLGIIKPQTVLKFCPTSLGDTTAGTWSVYFDGRDVNMKAAGEKLDALELLPDGRLLLSTKGDYKVKDAANNDLSGEDEDILVFTPTTLGPNTSGSFARYLDGSTVPGLGTEDLTGIYYNPLNGDLHITILGPFNVGGVSGGSSDIIILRPNGGGGYNILPYWHGPDDGWNYVLRSMHIDLP